MEVDVEVDWGRGVNDMCRWRGRWGGWKGDMRLMGEVVVKVDGIDR